MDRHVEGPEGVAIGENGISPRVEVRMSRRQDMLAHLGESFDLLIIGGGVTGCGAARDAARRGLRVLLVEMDDLASAPGRPNMYGLVQGDSNAIQPGKRPLSAMTPSIVVGADGQLRMVVGTPGGPRIITMVYHVISNVLDHGMSLADAVTAPRLHDQGLPDVIRVERGGFQPAALEQLRKMGHEVNEGGYTGDIEAIIRTPAGWQGVSDPRLGGGGAGY